MKTETPKTIHLKDYQLPDFTIEKVNLLFDLFEDKALVENTMEMKALAQGSKTLTLDGVNLTLNKIEINGTELKPDQYKVTEETLTITEVPQKFTLKITNTIFPDKNTSLEGLYKSGGMFCTQCEAQGFRKITYFLDRPDVMTTYTTTIRADQKRYPRLLSNGNPISQKNLADGRHEAIWHDPFKKPSYLFALVAGDLEFIEDSFKTVSGRNVKLQIYVHKQNISKCAHAMESVKKAMKWDEVRFGREYDLDIYMIVAVDDFNAGAMENKGLNIFNSAYVLANPETATDQDYEAIEAVIGHEYFHNWTGNRITCRDWFQLSLKEGLTVFRDQEFSSDMHSRSVRRIDAVNNLRTFQFQEDAGPMAHPIRPSSYITIDNFYTRTVYEKGSEVIRMIHTLLGETRFRKGMDKYFELFDGQAVTTEDFVKAMEVANNVDLTHFKNWYDQAGTPEVHVASSYDQSKKTLKLDLKQNCRATPGQPHKKPFHIPLEIGLVSNTGENLNFKLKGQSYKSVVLELKETEQSFVFEDVGQRPVLSLLRQFSAPVVLNHEISDSDLLTLMTYDADDFNRWESAQKLSQKTISELMKRSSSANESHVSATFLEAFAKVLNDSKVDNAFKARMLTLPSVSYVAGTLETIDYGLIDHAHRTLTNAIAKAVEAQFLSTYKKLNTNEKFSTSAKAIGERALKNLCLQFLSKAGMTHEKLCYAQFTSANNMTDQLAALTALCSYEKSELKEKAVSEFYDKWKNEFLVVGKWYRVQACANVTNALETVKKLYEHPSFSLKNPNKVYSLFVAFGLHNPVQFNDHRGEGYKFITDMILKIEKENPMVAARVASCFSQVKRLEPQRKKLVEEELRRILKTENLSKNLFEVASKFLE